MQREPFEFSGFVKNFGSPAVRLRRGLDVAQHGADVNRLAVVAAVIFAEPFHYGDQTATASVSQPVSPQPQPVSSWSLKPWLSQFGSRPRSLSICKSFSTGWFSVVR